MKRMVKKRSTRMGDFLQTSTQSSFAEVRLSGAGKGLHTVATRPAEAKA